MRNYIKADFKRIFAKRIHCILIVLIYLAIAALAVLKASNEETYMGTASMIAGTLPIYFGTIVFFAVFSDDAKARTMQVAIGRGLTRKKVIYAKIIEGLLLASFYYVLSGVLLNVIPAVMHVSISSAYAASIWTDILTSIFDTMFFFLIGLMIIAGTLKTNFAEIFFILCVVDVIPGVINFGLAFAETSLGMPSVLPYLYESCVNAMIKDPLANLGSILGVVIYLWLTTFLAVRFFQKKELEF